MEKENEGEWMPPRYSRASPHNENFGALRSILRQLARSFLAIRQDYCEICEQSGHKLSSQSALVPLCGEALADLLGLVLRFDLNLGAASFVVAQQLQGLIVKISLARSEVHH